MLRVPFAVVVFTCLWACAPRGDDKPAANEDRSGSPVGDTQPTTTANPPVAATPTAAPESATGTTPANTPPSRAFVGSARDQDEILAALLQSPATRFRALGNSSVVLRATLESGFDAAFKVNTKTRNRAGHAEVAAYRLARLIGLDNVPPAITRSYEQELVRSRITSRRAWAKILEELVEGQPTMTGAAIYWVPDLGDIGMDGTPGTRRYAEWLRHDGNINPTEQALARDVSNMILLDCLIGNWDRWSGGNVKGNAGGTRLYIRDHDAAFPSRLSEILQRRLFERLVTVERFSASVVANVRALTQASFIAELSLDPAGAALLDQRQITTMFDRRDAVLSHIDALILEHGDDSVLTFP